MAYYESQTSQNGNNGRQQYEYESPSAPYSDFRTPQDERYERRSSYANRDRGDRDNRSYSGSARGGGPRRDNDRSHQNYDNRRDYERHRERRDENDLRSSRYNPYPSPAGGRASDHRHSGPDQRAPPPMPTAAHTPMSHQAYYPPPSNSGPPSMGGPMSPMAPTMGGNYSDRPSPRYEVNGQFNHGPFKDKSTASQSVIFMGLPLHTDEGNLRAFLEEMGCSVDSCTIIYDRNTGQSKRYGFARFISVEHARAFVDPNFPIIVWKEPRSSRFEPAGDGLRIKIDFSQKEKFPNETRRDRDFESSHGNPNNGQPHQNHYQSPPPHAPPPAINDGARDIGGSPSSILLLRGLDPLTTEHNIAQNLQLLPDPSGAITADSVRRVMLVKDRSTRGSWGFAFVHFEDVQIAVKVLSLLLNSTIFPRGFQIKARSVTVTFAHEHSFHPVYTKSEWSFRTEGSQELAYWDDKAYVSMWLPPNANNGVTGASEEKGTVKTPVKDNAEIGPASNPNKPAGDDDAAMNEFLSSIEADDPQATNNAPNGASNEATATGEADVKKGDTPMRVVSALQPVTPAFVADIPPTPTAVEAAMSLEPKPETSNEEIYDFRDLVKFTCGLCQRQFKNIVDLDRHVDLSALHKKNSADKDVVATMRKKREAQLAKASKPV